MSDWTTGAPGDHPEEVADQIHGATTGPHEGAAEGGTTAGAGDGDAAGAAAGPGAGAGGIKADIFSRLADAGEEVMSRVAGMPGATRALEQAQTALARLDELHKRVAGVEALERRVVELEARVAELESRDPGRRVDAIGYEA